MIPLFIGIDVHGFEMFQRLLLLLLVPSMLMPPGRCICQFAPGEAPTSPPGSISRQSSIEQVKNHHANDDCSCSSCRSQSEPVANANRETRHGHPANESPCQEPTKHWPGCPVAIGAAPIIWIVPAVTIPVNIAATVSCLMPLCSPTGSVVGPICVSTRTSGPPLFISHCSLLI